MRMLQCHLLDPEIVQLQLSLGRFLTKQMIGFTHSKMHQSACVSTANLLFPQFYFYFILLDIFPAIYNFFLTFSLNLRFIFLLELAETITAACCNAVHLKNATNSTQNWS